MKLATTEEIIAAVNAGRMVILVDAEDRENEGDLLIAAECITPEAINFMITHGRGLVCLTLSDEKCQELGLKLMVENSNNSSTYGTSFTTSIEAAQGITTGISAFDRAHTIKTAIAANAKPSDLSRPGHIFPLIAKNGGVLKRAGHTEAGCDLAKLAGYTPAAVICEIINNDGSMARLPQLKEFAQQHNLLIGTIADLIKYRSRTEKVISRINERILSTYWGTLQAITYCDHLTKRMHLALIKGKPDISQATLTYIYESFDLLDLLANFSSPNKQDTSLLLNTLASSNCGAVVLLNVQDSGNTLSPSYQKEKAPSDKSPLPFDDQNIAAQILKDIGIKKIHLPSPTSNNAILLNHGLEITQDNPVLSI